MSEREKEVKVSQELRDLTDAELKERYKEWISTYDRAARRALLSLYDRQTEDERRYPDKVHQSNGWGFSEQDQAFLSNIAHQVLHGVTLSPRQYMSLKELLPKYAGQLVKITRMRQREEDLENGIAYYKMMQFEINSNERLMKGTFEELRLSPDGLPHTIHVDTPSGNMRLTYHLLSIGFADGDGKPIAIYQTDTILQGNSYRSVWVLRIAHREEEEDLGYINLAR